VTLHEYFVHLLQSALTGDRPLPKPDTLTWQEIYAMAKKHSLTTMVLQAANVFSHELNDGLYEKWLDRSTKLVAKFVNQEFEESRLSDLLENAKIPHMLLKGAWVRNLFPSPQLREMSDIDILIPASMATKAHDLVVSDGYVFKEECTTSHNTEYVKKPYLILELHTAMLPLESRQSDYYEDIWSKTTKISDYRHELSVEQQFIYCIAHMHKHYIYCGIGIRSVLDIFVLLKAYCNQFDIETIRNEFKKLGMEQFAEAVCHIALAWFGKKEYKLTASEQEIAEDILNSETYGNRSSRTEHILKNEMNQGKSMLSAKRSYLRRRMFPDYNYMKGVFPRMMKSPILLPVGWVARWGKGLFTKKDSMKKELIELREAEKKMERR